MSLNNSADNHMGSIISNNDFLTIAETDLLILGGCWESIFLIDKKTNKEIHLGNLDGIVDIGIISRDNSWAITGREVILLWNKGRISVIDKTELACVDGMKLIADDLVQLDIDTLNLNGNKSKWSLNTTTLELAKLGVMDKTNGFLETVVSNGQNEWRVINGVCCCSSLSRTLGVRPNGSRLCWRAPCQG